MRPLLGGGGVRVVIWYNNRKLPMNGMVKNIDKVRIINKHKCIFFHFFLFSSSYSFLLLCSTFLHIYPLHTVYMQNILSRIIIFNSYL